MRTHQVIPAGTRYGALTVIERSPHTKDVFYRCRCDCGNISTPALRSLRRGRTRSCGCLKETFRLPSVVRHGMVHHPLYNVYRGMLARCTNAKHNAFAYYGGRGIAVCAEWTGDGGVDSFLAWAVLRWKKGLQLNRVDNDKGYSPGNCEFTTPKKNSANRRNSVLISVKGRLLPISDAAEKFGVVAADVVRSRIRLGWPVELALTSPKNMRKSMAMAFAIAAR
jgi:hypothetical protein